MYKETPTPNPQTYKYSPSLAFLIGVFSLSYRLLLLSVSLLSNDDFLLFVKMFESVSSLSDKFLTGVAGTDAILID
jgi:hypothetical protein